MGYSPKRWLNALTILSACFLAAIVIVLMTMRSGPAGRIANTRPTVMPTAESGIVLPHVDPNRATILPLGEQPREKPKVHRTGDGFEPDRTNNPQPGLSSRASQPQPQVQPEVRQPAGSQPGSLPSFGSQVRNGTGPLSRRSQEVAPAPVQLVRPISSSFGVAGESSQGQGEPQPGAQSSSNGQSQPGAQAQPPNGGGGQPAERDPSIEREPPQGLGAIKPAQENRAGQ
jgi:hypothetical protein